MFCLINLIYKQIGKDDFKEYKAINGNTFTFTDNYVTEGIVSYGLVVKTSYGGESEMIVTSLSVIF